MSYKPGSVIGDYVVVGAVGTGGMGTVYKVQHVITQRIEAMKLLASGHTEPEQEQRFLREMQVQARLHHPNIASVYNAFRYYDEFFLVLEFIEGESLESVLSRGRLPLATGLHYARQALFALGYAHAHGVVHRDIAPSNMIITPEGVVKLTDFGLAKTATDVRLTHSGTPLGSPWYMSPEQVRGDAEIDARSDIYSLGVVLYEIATGSKPFDLASTFDVMRAQVEMAPLRPDERVPDLPPALNQAILTALAKDPRSRFQSAEQFYAELEGLQAGAAPELAPAAAAPLPVQPASQPRSRPAARPAFRWSGLRSRRALQMAVGTAACGVVLLGAYATSGLLRSEPAPLPALTPVKPNIPPPPEYLLPEEPAASAAAPETDAAPAGRVEPARPSRNVHKLATRTLAPLVFTPRPQPELLPPPPARLLQEPNAKSAPADVAGPATASAAKSSALPGVAGAAPRAVNPLDSVEPAPQPPAESAVPEKKHKNRFFRALHKVFRKDEDGAADPAAPGADSPK